MAHSIEKLEVAVTKKAIQTGLNTKKPFGSIAKLEWHFMHLFQQGKKENLGRIT